VITFWGKTKLQCASAIKYSNPTFK